MGARPLPTQAQAPAVPGLTPDGLIPVLRACWSAETSNDPAAWGVDNPSYGQCAVTALVVQHFFGGDLVRGAYTGGSHYWNRLPDGVFLDATAAQFDVLPDFLDVGFRDRTYLLANPDTARRGALLQARVENALAARGNKPI